MTVFSLTVCRINILYLFVLFVISF